MGTRARGGAAVVPGLCRGHFVRPWIRSGGMVHYRDAAVAGMLAFENNLRNIIALVTANNA